MHIFCFLGFSALHEDMDSPQLGQRIEIIQRLSNSGQQPPVVSVEDLFFGVSSASDAQNDMSQSGQE